MSNDSIGRTTAFRRVYRIPSDGDNGQPPTGLIEPTGPQDDEKSAEATPLAALLQSDNASNTSSMHVTTSITLGCVTYLTATLFALATQSWTLSPFEFLLLPLPVYFLQVYQLLLAVAVMRRSKSAALIEQRIAGLAGLADEYSRGSIGSPTTEEVTNIEKIAKGSGALKPLRWFLAVISYVGFYSLGMAYTIYMFAQVWSAPTASEARYEFWFGSSLYFFLWIGLIVLGLISLNESGEAVRRFLNIAILMVATVGVTGQFAHYYSASDPVHPLHYFTVLSAIILGLSCLTSVIWKFWTRTRLALTAQSFVIYSGAIYWTAIFWTQGMGDTAVAMATNMVLHLILPGLVVLLQCAGIPRAPRNHWVIIISVVAYSIFLVILQSIGFQPPYVFVDTSLDWLVPILAMVTTIVLSSIISWLLCKLRDANR